MKDKLRWRKSFKPSNFSNKLVIFLLGVIFGSGLSLMVTNFPKDFFKTRQSTKFVKDKPEFDPFVKFNLPMNNRINARIQFFLHAGRRADLLESYKRAGRYLPIIHAIFEEYNLPQVFVFLPILESRFIPNSRSRAGAVGLWQIMPATASDYGLKYNRWIDERRDPEKSTIVAAEYLRFLYDKFGDWDLALAAYNYGYRKLMRAMRREKATSFWQLRHIPRETYNFVPNFYATLHLFANPDKYGLKLPPLHEPLNYETIDIEATFSIQEIARLADVSPHTIKGFNPALIGNIAPSGKYSLKVPVGVKDHFLKQYQESPPDRVEITYTSYQVKRGDTLHRIAKMFGTTVNEIKVDNNLRSTRWIYPDMKLRIGTVTVIKQAVNAENKEEIQAIADAAQAHQIKFLYRAERDELSLNTLARYYSVTVEDLKAWNAWL
ncbi:MAG: transglycosylase SLT domain-containing protein, partial [bacterium]